MKNLFGLNRTSMLGLAFVAFILASVSWASAGVAIDSDTIVELAAKMNPSVVNISTTQVFRQGPASPYGGQGSSGDPFEEFFKRFFGDFPKREFKRQSLGSGFIISEDGYIITNNHVVENATDIKVILSDKSEYHSKVVGRDPKTDLALIKIDANEKLQAAQLGDSDNLKVGAWVIAIGNPFGLGHTVTAGIVSAKGRIIGAGPYDDFIQTDTSINPGNSGGPLFDIYGNVVGINTAIISGGQGIGFAIPINLAKSFIPQLRDKGSVVRGWLGIYIQPVTRELAEMFGLDDAKGALVGEVMDDSPAEKGGLRRGDIILEYQEESVEEANDLPRMVAATPVGRRVNIKIFRDGKDEVLKVKVGKLEDKEEYHASTQELKDEIGLVVQELTPEIAQNLGVGMIKGVIVSGVEPGSSAEESGVQRGDIILEANRHRITNVKEFKRALKKKNATHLFLIQRGRSTLYLAVKTG